MEKIEQQALVERINDAIEKTRDDMSLYDDAQPYAHGFKAASRRFIEKLEGLRTFADALSVEEAEAYLAATLQTRVKARAKAPSSAHKHEQPKRLADLPRVPAKRKPR